MVARTTEGLAGRLTPVVIDVSAPLRDIATGGADALWITVLAAGQPIDRVIIPSPSDPCPSEYVARALATHGSVARLVTLRSQFETPNPPVAASVVVCTRNRPDALQRCLAALGRLSQTPQQTLVVDNGQGGGSTAEVVRSFGVDYAHEPEPGLDRARNHGIAASTGEIIAFTDDDVEVEVDWLARLAGCFRDPLTAAATGLVLPARLDTDGQCMFEKYAGFVRRFEPRVLDGAYDVPTSAGSAGAGASMAFRRDFLEEIGGFAEVLDAGMPTRTGGDTAALYRVLRRGRRIRYEPRAIAFHTHRESVAAVQEAVRGYGTGTMSYLAEAAVEERDAGAGIAGVRWVGNRLTKFASATARGRSTERNLLASELRGMAEAPRALPNARRIVRSRTSPVREAPGGWEPTRIGGAPLDVRREEWDWFPTLSVVIPSRGRCRSLTHLITRLTEQEYPHDRLQIVVSLDDDIDGSAEAVHRMDLDVPVDVLVSERGGPGVARNRGAARASGDVLVFLDDDVEPAHRLLLVEHARALRGADAAVGMINPTAPDLADLASIRLRNWWMDHATHLLDQCDPTFSDVSSGNLSIRRELFAKLEGFADLRRHEDWELGYRTSDPGPTCRWHLAPRSATRRDRRSTTSWTTASTRVEATSSSCTATPRCSGCCSSEDGMSTAPNFVASRGRPWLGRTTPCGSPAGWLSPCASSKEPESAAASHRWRQPPAPWPTGRASARRREG